MKDVKSMLPPDVLAKAIISGNEYGWRRQDVFQAIAAATSVGLAILGGQVQFILPEGTCELYWMDYDPADRKPDEPWQSYVTRSGEETALALQRVMTKDLVQEGINHFALLKQKHSQGVCLEDFICFIVYFLRGQ